MKKQMSLFVCLLIGIAWGVRADKIAYWRFDGGVADSDAMTLESEFNAPTLNGTAAKSNNDGRAPIYSLDVPAPVVYARLGGEVLNGDNSSSLRFVNTGLPENENSYAGGVVVVPSDELLHLDNFTVQAFVKMGSKVNYPLIVGFSRADNSNTSWNMDFDNSGKPRLRIDTHAPSMPAQQGTPGWNEVVTSTVDVNDGMWHHLAFTYENDNRRARLYVDGIMRAERHTHSNLVYNPGELRIGHGAGGRAFDGWIDEVSISEGVLTPAEFMTVLATTETVGYWAFEDGAAESYAVTLTNDFYAPMLYGVAGNTAGEPLRPEFSSEIPFGVANLIYDGEDGELLRVNTGSLLFSNNNSSDNKSKEGCMVVVPGGVVSESLTNFTAEAFIRIRNQIDFAQIVGKKRKASGGHSWSLAVNEKGRLRTRFDVQELPGNDGFNQSLESSGNVDDGEWHHVALTYDDESCMVHLYVDYVEVGEKVMPYPIKLDSGDIVIGAGDRAFDGWIDEVRISNRVLSTAEFLRARPPAGTIILVR